MIPKIIHYCWFGGKSLPPLALECISSWRKYLPEYEIWQWSENSPILTQGGEQVADRYMSFDVNSIPYTAEAFRQKKYAFVSDYCRFMVMYEYGGLYFDTDVEVIKPMDDIIAKGNFMGFEVDPDGDNTPGSYAPRYCFAVNPGLGFGMEKEHPFMKEMIDLYHRLKFEPVPDDIAWYKTIVAYVTEMLCSRGLKDVRGIQNIVTFSTNPSQISIYPSEYFAPIDSITNCLHLTNQTRSIHRYAGSWGNGKSSFVGVVKHYLPGFILLIANRIKRKKYKIR